MNGARDLIVTTSWDDGHKLDLRLAALLKKYGVRGTFYISPECREIAPELRLSGAEIVALSQDFEIGAHTLTHPRLATCDELTSRTEIAGSKSYLEKLLGNPVTSFCYPGGSYTTMHARLVKEAGFTLGRTVQCFATEVGDDPYTMPTSVQAYRHWSHLVPIMRHVGLRRFAKCYLNWDELAIALFDAALESDGVFHLWGHSWEIERNGDWDRLERVLKHIARRESVRYAENRELV